MVTYGQPRRFNLLTGAMLLVVLAGAYWFWRFFPAYFDGWNVDHVLREAVTSTYRVVRIREPERGKRLKEIVDKARADVMKMGNVTDPNLLVNLNLDGDKATMTADYHVVITHPYTPRTTTLHFVKVEATSVKRVDWE
jgi:hypothetical protein